MMNETMVYVVAGGWQYDGEHLESARVFLNREDAVQHGEFLLAEDSYHYYKIKEVEVG